MRSFALLWNSALTPTPLTCFACFVLQLFYVLENFDITAKAMDQSSAYYLAEATDAASSSSQPALLRTAAFALHIVQHVAELSASDRGFLVI